MITSLKMLQCYFYFQIKEKSHFQKISASYASVSGFSLDSLSAGQVVGFSANPRTTDNFDTEKYLPNPSTNTGNYNTSQAWENTITNTSNANHLVKQPTNTNRVQTLLQPARQPSQTSQDQPSGQTPEGRPPSQIFISALPTLNISIPVAMQHHFSSWHFPQNLSQSSIQGQSGSNACTLTALTNYFTWPQFSSLSSR